MTVPAVANDAAPVILGMSPDRLIKRYVLPKEVAGWGAVKGKQLGPRSSVPGPQKVHATLLSILNLACPAFQFNVSDF